MRYIPLLFIASILVGCTASAKYDFDLTCPRDNFANAKGDGDTTYACTGPKFFNLVCVDNTIAYIDSVQYCTTHDGKSVRIRLQ